MCSKILNQEVHIIITVCVCFSSDKPFIVQTLTKLRIENKAIRFLLVTYFNIFISSRASVTDYINFVIACLHCSRPLHFSLFPGYFDTFFDLDTPVMFTTGPHGTATHWKQTLFYLAEKKPVKAGQAVKGKIRVSRPRDGTGHKVSWTEERSS